MASTESFKRKYCETCGAPIIWAVSTLGRKLPVDAEPSAAGNVKLKDGGPVPVAEVSSLPVEGGRLSHFVTCPQADQWRGRPRGARS